MTAPALTDHESVLTDEILIHCCERSAGYDRDNTFFTEDFQELQQAGYLTVPIPEEFGGQGLTLAEVAREQRRLGYYAAPSALAINMHLYWLGVAADLWRAGDKSLQWVLEEGARGQIFAAGHAESGNDIPLLLSTTKAERVDGGYRFTGHKSFGSLTPVWSFFGLHGLELSGTREENHLSAATCDCVAGACFRNPGDVLADGAHRTPCMKVFAIVDSLVEETSCSPARRPHRVCSCGAGSSDHLRQPVQERPFTEAGSARIFCPLVVGGFAEHFPDQ